jgi:hypothetical protein
MDAQENPGVYWAFKALDLLRPDTDTAERAVCRQIADALEALHNDRKPGGPHLGERGRQANLQGLTANVKQLVDEKGGNEKVQILLPVLAEATRAALGFPRGVRVLDADDEGSRGMTEAEREQIRRKDPRREL